MCGIAGIVRRSPASQSEVERMTRAIAHRGPDGVGFYRRDGVALGHRRLAIIDPELGIQPMSDQEETVWLIYNGELYNFRELKTELESYGCRFVTNSDTEVVIEAYKKWGPECLKKFRGMFGFALADFRNRVLFLARDHFGIKPLYYRLGKDYLAFASELSALRQVDDSAPTGRIDVLEMYLRYGYIPTPHTIYREVFKLPPASYLVVPFDTPSAEPVKYWDLRFEPQNGLSDSEWEERAHEVIHDSVRAHLVADVPFGVFLSGGIDSTIVAWQMSEILERPVRAFAIGFQEEKYSELKYAEEAARRCGVELHTEVVQDDALEMLPDLVAHYGEPFGDSSCIPTWYVSRLAREHVPMVLSGDGGDEAFAGYWSYDAWMESNPWTRARGQLKSAAQFASQLHPRASLHSALAAARAYKSDNNLAEWEKICFQTHEHSRRSLWRPELQYLINGPSDSFQKGHLSGRAFQRLSYAQYMDYQTYLPCDILTKVDVASMYHGLEVRTPLIDRKVVEFAASLPPQQRLRRNGNGKAVGKYITKKLLSKVFPKDFIHRPKMGFGIPRAEWFYEGRRGWQLWQDVTADGAPLYNFFNRREVLSAMERHSPAFDNSGALWFLLFLGIWLEQNPQISFSD